MRNARVVVDTNILVSGIIKPSGLTGAVLRQLRDGNFTILYAPVLLDELVDVLNRPRICDKYRIAHEDIKTIVALVMLRGEGVTPDRKISVCRDPKDDMFLEIAVAGDADVIVSGDEDLLVLNPFEGIQIVAPRDFLHMLHDRA
ncbi:MAG: putative toxin-antitoxin system toxin component, PIN family [Anaerolineae bacterium]|nr:putative toxin-antitoxin system toxin component, PIN family [Anaerolineae bacterium]MCO5194716.1 putative toxin-antitoxin system toxin component, PIN family [Anaerolineae bacterium]MCO5204080.1 putative toxin-antitoxin system toxin component, PIN family [Anaerolineae bacterium]